MCRREPRGREVQLFLRSHKTVRNEERSSLAKGSLVSLATAPHPSAAAQPTPEIKSLKALRLVLLVSVDEKMTSLSPDQFSSLHGRLIAILSADTSVSATPR